jgi:hypothetical protein
MHPTALNPGERVDCFPLGVALALEEDEVEVVDTTTEEDAAAVEETTDELEAFEDEAALEDAELELATDEAAALDEATELDETTELDDATTLDEATEVDDATVLEEATELDEATEEDATLGTGKRAGFWNKVKVELPPQFSVYWASEQAMEHRVLSKRVALVAPLAKAIPQ